MEQQVLRSCSLKAAELCGACSARQPVGKSTLPGKPSKVASFCCVLSAGGAAGRARLTPPIGQRAPDTRDRATSKEYRDATTHEMVKLKGLLPVGALGASAWPYILFIHSCECLVRVHGTCDVSV